MGIGVDAYTCSSVNPLEFAVDDVRLFRDLLGAAFEGEPLADPDETAARAYLRTVKASMADEPGPLVMMWAGHATPSRVVPLRLLARDSDPDQDGGLDAVGDVASAVAYSGANQVLFVVDTCYSGAAVSATEAVAAVMAARPPDAQYVWVGVLASCLPVETARDGALGRRLRELLTHGPSDPVLRARWSVHNELIRGDDLCDAALKEWGNHAQSPQFQGNGSAWWMFRNPLYVAGAPERVVEHLLRAARGGHEREEHSWFTGRVAEVDQIVGWVRDGEPGVYVVTGSAGTGKSAIVGRVVSLSNPEERARLEHEGRPWVHADPGEGAVHAHVHARGLTADRAADELAEGLVRCGFLPPQEARRNASELVGEVQRAVEEGKGPPRLVIDGLDEARGESFSLAEDLVRRLARHAVVIVSTREVGRGDDQPSLLEALVPEGPLLNLDDPEVRERGRRDLRDYVAARLADRDERMDGAAVANRLVVDASMKAGAPFLLARLVTDQLIAEPVDTSQPDWQTRVSSSIEEAFDKDLARSTREWGASLGGEASAAAVARQCLRALTWGFGAGLPEDEWLVVVNAITPALSAGRDELSWVLEHLGRYIVQDGEGGVAVYRLAHQSLADYLRSPWQEQPHEPFDPAALQIARALLDRYRTLTEHGVSPFAPSYLWLYAWRHAASAGREGVDALRRLAEQQPSLLPDVGAASLAVVGRLVRWGRLVEAVAPSEEAVEIYRPLAAEDPAFEAHLAGALDNVGVRYSQIGRRGEAVAPTEEAVELRRALAAENPAFLADLAGTLNNLGTHYNHLGRSVDAVAPTEEAVELYRPLAAENPVFLPDLASTLKNLSAHSEAAGTPERAQLAWQAALESFRGADAAFLLVARAGAAPPGDRHVAVWLASAHRLAAGDRRVLADLHDEVRRHREADRDGFDAAWTCGSGEPVPAWADVELSLLATAAAWITTPTYDDERDFLERHEELLDPSADVAVEEALLDVAEDNAERYTSLRMAARTHGVDAAYRPLLLSQLAVRFITRDAAAQRALVAERRNELLTDEVRAFVASFAGEHEEPAARRASALLELIALDDEDEDEAFAALEDFARFNTWLAALARRSEVGALAPAAMLMASSATTSAETASAGFYLAVAAAIAGQADDASGLLDAARSLHPPGRAAWIRELAELGQQHPEVLTLIGELTVDPSAEGGRDGDGAAD